MLNLMPPEVMLFRFKIWITILIVVFTIYSLYGSLVKASYQKLIPIGRVLLFFSMYSFSSLVLGLEVWLSILISVLTVAISTPYMKGLKNINEIARREKTEKRDN